MEHEPDLLGYPDDTVWAVSAGGGGFDHANAIAIDAKDNAVITGEVVGGPWYAASLGPGGDFNWKIESLTSGGYYGAAVAVHDNGDVLVTGGFSGTLQIGGLSVTSKGRNDVFVARLSNSGKPLWLWSGGGDEDDGGGSIAVDSQGNSFITGYFYDVTTGPGTAGFGDKALTSAGAADIFVVKLSPAGKLLWARSAGGPDEDSGHSVASVGDGGLVVCGTYRSKADFGGHTLTSLGERNFFVMRMSADGRVLWATSGGGAEWDVAHAIAVEPLPGSARQQSLFVAGSHEGQSYLGPFTLTSRGKTDCFVAKLDPWGKFVWAKNGGGADIDSCIALAVTRAAVNVVGYFWDRAHFGTTTLVSRGDEDVFVASFAYDGALKWVTQAGGPRVDLGVGPAPYSDGTLGVTGIFRDQAYFGRTKLVSQGATDIFVWRLRPPM